LYKQDDIGELKTYALQQNVKAFTGIEIKTINKSFEPEDVKDADIVIAAVDVMSVRKEILEACTTKTKRFIDCRMMSMAFEIYSYIPVYENDLYLATRFPDEEATTVACTNKSSSFNTFAIAGFITRFVVGITKDEKSILDRSQLTVDLSNLIIA
jgi:molybdopterin/thiamine biosynthesis adenylyltransferase